MLCDGLARDAMPVIGFFVYLGITVGYDKVLVVHPRPMSATVVAHGVVVALVCYSPFRCS